MDRSQFFEYSLARNAKLMNLGKVAKEIINAQPDITFTQFAREFYQAYAKFQQGQDLSEHAQIPSGQELNEEDFELIKESGLTIDDINFIWKYKDLLKRRNPIYLAKLIAPIISENPKISEEEFKRQIIDADKNKNPNNDELLPEDIQLAWEKREELVATYNARRNLFKRLDSKEG